MTLTTALEIETGHHYDHPTTPLPIEGYSLIGDCGTAAIVRRDGATDWRIGKGAKALSATSLRLEVAF